MELHSIVRNQLVRRRKHTFAAAAVPHVSYDMFEHRPYHWYRLYLREVYSTQDVSTQAALFCKALARCHGTDVGIFTTLLIHLMLWSIRGSGIVVGSARVLSGGLLMVRGSSI